MTLPIVHIHVFHNDIAYCPYISQWLYLIVHIFHNDIAYFTMTLPIVHTFNNNIYLLSMYFTCQCQPIFPSISQSYYLLSIHFTRKLPTIHTFHDHIACYPLHVPITHSATINPRLVKQSRNQQSVSYFTLSACFTQAWPRWHIIQANPAQSLVFSHGVSRGLINPCHISQHTISACKDHFVIVVKHCGKISFLVDKQITLLQAS